MSRIVVPEGDWIQMDHPSQPARGTPVLFYYSPVSPDGFPSEIMPEFWSAGFWPPTTPRQPSHYQLLTRPARPTLRPSPFDATGADLSHALRKPKDKAHD